MRPSFKEALAQKITSEDQYIAILNGNDHYVGNEFGAMRLGTKDRKISWWAHRETLRLEYQVYTTSTVLAELNKATKMHTHISLTDPKRVAYTPDKAFGEQDRQLVISLGKLIARLYPGLRDEEVQEMVQIHESEISDEVEFIQGFEAIDHAYKSMPEGLRACMSKSDDKYGGVSPLKAYDMPNIKLAVIRGHRGNITGRTMVYEASDTDKRFIRTYGDRVTIERRLDKLGYRSGTWHGAKFSTVVREDIQATLTSGRMAYIMPYLDGYNTAGGRSVSTVALIAGELTSVTERYAEAVDALQYASTAVCTDTSGYAVFRDFNPEKATVYDYLTGEKISTLDRPTKIKVGSIFVFTAAEMPVDRYIRAKTIVDGERCMHWMPRSDVWCSSGLAIDKKHLLRFGYVLLDATLYGPDQCVSENYCTETLDGKNVRTHDTVKVVGDSFTGIQRLHKSVIVANGKDKHIKLADDVYAVPGTKLYTTPSGRKVHPAVHAVTKRYDGMYDYSRNLRETKVLGERVYIPRAGGVPTGKGSEIYRDILQTRLEQGREMLCDGYPLVDVAEGAFDRSADGYSSYSGYYVNAEGNTVRISTSSALPVNEQMLSIERLAKAKGSDAAEVARYVCSILYAEMEAMEPGQLDRDMERLAAQARQEEVTQLALAQSVATTDYRLQTTDLTYQSGLFNPEVDQYQAMHLTVPDWAQSVAETAANTATGGSDRLSLYELRRSRPDNNATTDAN